MSTMLFMILIRDRFSAKRTVEWLNFAAFCVDFEENLHQQFKFSIRHGKQNSSVGDRYWSASPVLVAARISYQHFHQLWAFTAQRHRNNQAVLITALHLLFLRRLYPLNINGTYIQHPSCLCSSPLAQQSGVILLLYSWYLVNKYSWWLILL